MAIKNQAVIILTIKEPKNYMNIILCRSLYRLITLVNIGNLASYNDHCVCMILHDREQDIGNAMCEDLHNSLRTHIST